MNKKGVAWASSAILYREHFDELIVALKEVGLRVIAPTPRDDAIVLDEISSSADLPIGLYDKQEPGAYRLKKRKDKALFGYNVGPQSFKRYLHTTSEVIAESHRNSAGVTITSAPPSAIPTAFLGVRACELAALSVQDKILMQGPFLDPNYAARRQVTFVVAVNCGQATSNCFCTSLETGPKVNDGFDLALTEVIAGGEHYFLVETGSSAGAAIAARLKLNPATPEQISAGSNVCEEARKQVKKQLVTDGLPHILAQNTDHPRWDEVGARCLTCGACTMVCPTCFCMTIEDSTDLSGDIARRTKRLDSCFTVDFSYIHGGSIRQTPKSRYRQWMTHKLSSWVEQFGSMGCCGCGRCITWCPVGIDLTEEAAAIRASLSEVSHKAKAS